MGEGAEAARVMAEFNARGYLDFRMATATQTADILRDCGFEAVTTLGRSA